MSERVVTGLEACLADPPDILRGRRFGLLVNQASVDRQYRPACDLLAARFPGQLAALFSPQHGFWGEEQANMIESAHSVHPRLSIPIYSLYSESRRPTAETLRGIELLVVDLQDVGTRVYTFVWTVLNCLSACADAGLPVLILDRPNPLGGVLVEGAELCEGFRSFVGGADIPMRHGLTLAELCGLLNETLDIRADLHVVTLQNWRRSMSFAQTELPWVPPSPNLPTAAAALLYPGQVLLEGTTLSEGRGTATPFQFVGAPFIDPFELTTLLEARRLSGVRFRATRFRPAFDKWAGQTCGGVFVHVTDQDTFRPYCTTLHVLNAVARAYPEHFGWLPPPYEYETQRRPIDILSGDSRLREWIDAQRCLTDDRIDQLCRTGDEWLRRSRNHHLYV